MCMQDVDIARATRTQCYNSSSSEGIPANPDRLSIRLVPGLNDYIQLVARNITVPGVPTNQTVILGMAVGPDTSVTVVGGTLPDDVTLEKVGDILKGPLTLVTSGATDGFAIETYLPVNSGMSLDVSKLP